MYDYRIAISIPDNTLQRIKDGSSYNRSYTIRNLLDKAIPVAIEVDQPIVFPHGIGVTSVTIAVTKNQMDAINEFAQRHNINKAKAGYNLLHIGLQQPADPDPFLNMKF